MHLLGYAIIMSILISPALLRQAARCQAVHLWAAKNSWLGCSATTKTEHVMISSTKSSIKKKKYNYNKYIANVCVYIYIAI